MHPRTSGPRFAACVVAALCGLAAVTAVTAVASLAAERRDPLERLREIGPERRDPQIEEYWPSLITLLETLRSGTLDQKIEQFEGNGDYPPMVWLEDADPADPAGHREIVDLVFEELERALANETQPWIVYGIVEGLINTDLEAVDAMIPALARHLVPAVRVLAIEYATYEWDSGLREFLESMWEVEGTDLVRSALIPELQAVESERVPAICHEHLERSAPEFAEEAIWCLVEAGGDADVVALARRLATGADDPLQPTLLTAVDRVGKLNPRARTILERFWKRGTPKWMQATLLRVLAASDSTLALEAARKLMFEDESPLAIPAMAIVAVHGDADADVSRLHARATRGAAELRAAALHHLMNESWSPEIEETIASSLSKYEPAPVREAAQQVVAGLLSTVDLYDEIGEVLPLGSDIRLDPAIASFARDLEGEVPDETPAAGMIFPHGVFVVSGCGLSLRTSQVTFTLVPADGARSVRCHRIPGVQYPLEDSFRIDASSAWPARRWFEDATGTMWADIIGSWAEEGSCWVPRRQLRFDHPADGRTVNHDATRSTREVDVSTETAWLPEFRALERARGITIVDEGDSRYGVRIEPELDPRSVEIALQSAPFRESALGKILARIERIGQFEPEEPE